MENILTPDRLIAHACGEYKRLTYTNSLNALNLSYKKGFRLIEVDLNLTSDKRIILLHDWSVTSKKLLGTKGFITYRVFKNTKPRNGLQLLDMEGLSNWMRVHGDVNIVIDCKSNELYILNYIRKKYVNLLDRFIIETINPVELSHIRKMGFKKIMLMIRRSSHVDENIIRCIRENNLFAVSMDYISSKSDLPSKFKKRGIKVYTYTVNSVYRYEKLVNNGVYGVITDYLKLGQG